MANIATEMDRLCLFVWILSSFVASVGSATAPTITNLPLASALSVTENTAMGSPIFTVTGTDVDGDTLVYTPVYSPTSGSVYFDLDQNTGVVSLSTTSLIDYEVLVATTTSYDITVHVSDGGLSTSATLQLSVDDVNEAPTFPQSTYSISVDEGPTTTTFPNSNFGATDEDSGNTVTYAMACGAYNSYFNIDGTTGNVNYLLEYDLDIAGMPSLVNCTVTASDGTLSNSVDFGIYIRSLNDNSPIFLLTSYTFAITASEPVATVIGQVSATDADLDSNGVMTFSVDVSAFTDDYFGVTTTGDIFINKDLSAYSGIGASFTFICTATDVGGQSDTTTVKVNIAATTTVITTTTTDRYRTFFEDTRAIIWFSFCMAVVAAILVLTMFYCWYMKWINHVFDVIARVGECWVNCWKQCCESEERPPQFEVEESWSPPTTPVTVREPERAPQSGQWDFWTKSGDHL